MVPSWNLFLPVSTKREAMPLRSAVAEMESARKVSVALKIGHAVRKADLVRQKVACAGNTGIS